eukprot:366290-Chlamydomonas_euryale.AAC.9
MPVCCPTALVSSRALDRAPAVRPAHRERTPPPPYVHMSSAPDGVCLGVVAAATGAAAERRHYGRGLGGWACMAVPCMHTSRANPSSVRAAVGVCTAAA